MNENNPALPDPARPTLPAALCKPRLRRSEASDYLRIMHGVVVARDTLARYAWEGGGPLFQKVGRVPLYPIEELDAWALQRLGRLRRSTSDKGEEPTT